MFVQQFLPINGCSHSTIVSPSDERSQRRASQTILRHFHRQAGGPRVGKTCMNLSSPDMTVAQSTKTSNELAAAITPRESTGDELQGVFVKHEVLQHTFSNHNS